MDSTNEFVLGCRIGTSAKIDNNINSKIDKTLYRNISSISDESYPIVGREKELEWMCHRLLCRLKPNILIIGESGVGKTALVEGLAKFTQQFNNEKVKKFKFLEFSAGSLIAETSYRGDFEKKIIELINTVAAHESYVIFIDEAHTLAMTGDIHGGGVDALNMLKPFLTTGKIKCILATTPMEVVHLTKDKAFMRRFSILNLNPLSIDQKRRALKDRWDFLSLFHGVDVDSSYLDFIEKNLLNLENGLDLAFDFSDELLACYSLNSNQCLNLLMKSKLSNFYNTRRFLNEIMFNK